MIYYISKFRSNQHFIFLDIAVQINSRESQTGYEPTQGIKIDKLTERQEDDLKVRKWTYYDILHSKE